MTSNSVQAGIRIPGSPRYVPNAAAGISPLPSRRCPSGGRHWLGWFGSFVDCFSDVLRSFCSLPPCSVLKYSMLCLGSESCLPFSGGFGASFQTGFGSSSGKPLSGKDEARNANTGGTDKCHGQHPNTNLSGQFFCVNKLLFPTTKGGSRWPSKKLLPSSLTLMTRSPRIPPHS